MTEDLFYVESKIDGEDWTRVDPKPMSDHLANLCITMGEFMMMPFSTRGQIQYRKVPSGEAGPERKEGRYEGERERHP